MIVCCKIRGVNEEKMTEEDIVRFKNEMKYRLIDEIKYNLEKWITDDSIEFGYDFTERNTFTGTLVFDFQIFAPGRDNELKLETNKANSKQQLIICDKRS